MKSTNLARLIYPEFRFNATTMDNAIKLVQMGVGGFCFYGGTVEEVKETIKELKSYAQTPLIFCADYENGVGQWLKDATLLPTNMAIGASGSSDLARRKAEITAFESKALGVDWVLAPVVDFASKRENPIVNTRAFGDDIALVNEMTEAYLGGLNSHNCISCLKHFPGHGETDTDSHLTLPELKRTKEALLDFEIKPYKAFVKSADSIMIGHLKIDSIDTENVSSFSQKIITDLLRKEIGFDGCVVTDALSMDAISDEGRSGIMALLAGADILLVPKEPFKLFTAIENAYKEGVLHDELIEKALSRQNRMVAKISAGLLNRVDSNVIGCVEHKKFVEESAKECIAWAFKNRKFEIEPSETVGYLEPLAQSDNWQGKLFIEEMEKLGINIIPFNPHKTKKLIVASFSGPRAYSGSINLNEEQKQFISDKINLAEDSIMLSFGSPFVFDGLNRKISGGLCAFCALPDFQKTTAQILMGNKEARGKMPVKLKMD
ncbi:MAG: hypothetical protein KKD35_02570 [Elusimicrobia bacterium]|nr:hypothetical protein [Elusimicrobiota bacterium]